LIQTTAGSPPGPGAEVSCNSDTLVIMGITTGTRTFVPATAPCPRIDPSF
jgi:hypothetical protein